MNDIELISTIKSNDEMTQQEKSSLQKREKYLKKHRTLNTRYQKRKKLKMVAAEFSRDLQSRRGTNMDQHTMNHINAVLHTLLRLPFRWKDADIQKSFDTLARMRRKYLSPPYEEVLEDESKMLEEITTLFTQSKLTSDSKLRILLQLFTCHIPNSSLTSNVVEEEFLSFIFRQFPKNYVLMETMAKKLKAEGKKIHAKMQAETMREANSDKEPQATDAMDLMQMLAQALREREEEK